MPRTKLKPGMHVGPYKLLRKVSGRKWRVRHLASGRLHRISESALLTRMLAATSAASTGGVPTMPIFDNDPELRTATMFDVLRKLGIRMNRGE